jgi:hypothetical protein
VKRISLHSAPLIPGWVPQKGKGLITSDRKLGGCRVVGMATNRQRSVTLQDTCDIASRIAVAVTTHFTILGGKADGALDEPPFSI